PTAQARDRPFELSSVQQAYWLGRGAGEVLGNVSCHAFLEFRTRDVDPQRLAAAASEGSAGDRRRSAPAASGGV
ncbi:hypothetical protein, partial [Pseudomonas aeruginosa]